MSQKRNKQKRGARSNRPAPRQQVQRENVTYIPKEESPKGELFFKIILTVMVVAIIAVVGYFVIDSLVNREEDSDRLFEEQMYISYTNLDFLIKGNYESINSDYIDLALTHHGGINNLVVILYDGDYETLHDEGTSLYNRHTQVIDLVNQARNIMLETDSEDKDGFIYGRGYTFFYMDVSHPTVANTWQQLFTNVDELTNISRPLMVHLPFNHPEYEEAPRFIASSEIINELNKMVLDMETED